MHFDGLEGAPLLGRLEGSAGAEISDPGSGVHTEKQASGCNFQMDGSSIFSHPDFQKSRKKKEVVTR